MYSRRRCSATCRSTARTARPSAARTRVSCSNPSSPAPVSRLMRSTSTPWLTNQMVRKSRASWASSCGGLTSSTWWPSSVSSAAACSTARPASGCGVPRTADLVVKPMRSAPGAWSRSHSRGFSGSAGANALRSSGPMSRSSLAAVSRTVRDTTPLVDRPLSGSLLAGLNGIRPRPALSPTKPVQAAGMRIEPPPSLAAATGMIRAATAAAAPPEDPPGVRSRSHGLRVGPNSSASVTPFEPNSGVVVFREDLQPGIAPPLDDHAGLPGGTAGQRAASRGRRNSLDVLVEVLEQERHPGERAGERTGRLPIGVLVEAQTDGVDPGVQLVGPCPRQLLEFACGHLAGGDAAGQTQTVELDVLVVGHHACTVATAEWRRCAAQHRTGAEPENPEMR